MRRYLLFGNLPYALPILRPVQAAIRARGAEARWFFHGDGAQYLQPDEPQLRSAGERESSRQAHTCSGLRGRPRPRQVSRVRSRERHPAASPARQNFIPRHPGARSADGSALDAS